MVHFGIRRCMFARLGLWISPRRLALRSDRGYLVGGGGAAVVAGGKLTLTIRLACKSLLKGARFVLGHRFSDAATAGK